MNGEYYLTIGDKEANRGTFVGSGFLANKNEYLV
jgi:hypothetical protein